MPALGSADKYTTLLPLAWLIKPVLHLRFFSYEVTFLLNSHWLATFFEVKKVGSNRTFYCFRSKKVASYKKIRHWKTSFKIKFINKNCVNFIQISTAPAFNFEVMNELSNASDPIPSNFLKAVFHKFYLVHSWILFPMWALTIITKQAIGASLEANKWINLKNKPRWITGSKLHP